MTPESMWIVPAERIWEPNSFGTTSASADETHPPRLSHKNRSVSSAVFNTLDKVLMKSSKKKKQRVAHQKEEEQGDGEAVNEKVEDQEKKDEESSTMDEDDD